jgi:A distinct subfamily of CDD/CDA-like deaminases
VCEDDIECHSFEEIATEPAVKIHQTNSTVRLAVAELIKFKEEFYAIQEDKSIETDLSSFWLRKTKKPVLAVLLVQKPGQRSKLYRGTNMEVSMPTGSLCAERNVIGSALADDLTLRRQDLKVIVVYSVGSLDASRSNSNKDETPGLSTGSRRGSYESEDTLPHPTSVENVSVCGIDSTTCPRSHPSISHPSSTSSTSHHSSYSSSTSSSSSSSSSSTSSSSSSQTAKGRCRADSVDSIPYVHTRAVRSLSTVGVLHTASEDSLSRCPSTDTHSTVIDSSRENFIVRSTQHSDSDSGGIAGSSSDSSSAHTTQEASLEDLKDFISTDSCASILLNDMSPSDTQMSTTSTQSDTRRLITAGKRSYSVDSVWVMKGAETSDLEGAQSWSGGNAEVKEKVISPSNVILRTNSEPHMLDAWKLDADVQSR